MKIELRVELNEDEIYHALFNAALAKVDLGVSFGVEDVSIRYVHSTGASIVLRIDTDSKVAVSPPDSPSDPTFTSVGAKDDIPF